MKLIIGCLGLRDVMSSWFTQTCHSIATCKLTQLVALPPRSGESGFRTSSLAASRLLPPLFYEVNIALLAKGGCTYRSIIRKLFVQPLSSPLFVCSRLSFPLCAR